MILRIGIFANNSYISCIILPKKKFWTTLNLFIMEKEKKEEPILERVVQNDLEDAVLKYFADSHPDDTESFESVVGLLHGFESAPKEDLLNAIYKGLKYDADVEAARNEGYLSGANESIEQEKRRLQPMPVDDGGLEGYAEDLPLLSSVRRSVWEL